MKELYINPALTENEFTFSTIQKAINSVPKDNSQWVTLQLAPGIYREKLVLDRPFLRLQGAGAKSTQIVFGDYGLKPWSDGFKCGTFRSYSVFIDSHDISVSGIGFVNDAGFGKDVGQALALYADGDRLTFDGCHFLGSQDTLFTGPLPPKEIEPGGFRGPKQFAPRVNGRHYYKNCYIRGDIDFIFGSATAFFENCEIFAQKTDMDCAASSIENQKIYSYITAPSTPEGQTYGYVFQNCRLTSDCPPASVYLGRPWRDYAKAVFLSCDLGKHIHPAGFHDWNKPQAHETCFFAEYKNFGEGASPETRSDFVTQLTDNEACLFSKQNVLCGEDGWLPD